jgi:DNA-binding HxlR family transcriptional regulator
VEHARRDAVAGRAAPVQRHQAEYGNTGGISQQMLTRTLRGLELDGMLTRTIPPQVEYQLSEMGLSLSEPALAFGQ